jgi:hypothetical protein
MQRGRYLKISLPRRWIADLLHFARQVPTVPVERIFNLGQVRQSRQAADISWPAIFLKAFALTGRQHPELRHAWIKYPRPRLYEHPFTVASVAVERTFAGEPAVFFAQIREVDFASLRFIDGFLKRIKQDPVESNAIFRRAIRLAKLPVGLRRLIWWLSLNWSGEKRAKRMGTMGLSVYASLGASSLHPLSPLSYVLNYGVMDDAGKMVVRLIYDHRVADGATIARALATMEQIMLKNIQGELIDEAKKIRPVALSA